MTKLSSPQFRAFVSVLRGYMHDLETASPRESLMKQLALQELLTSFQNVELSAAREGLLVAAKALIARKAAGRQETLTLVRLDPKPAHVQYGPGDRVPMGDRLVSWETMMSS